MSSCPSGSKLLREPLLPPHCDCSQSTWSSGQGPGTSSAHSQEARGPGHSSTLLPSATPLPPDILDSACFRGASILPASAHLVLLSPHEAGNTGTALSRWGWAARRGRGACPQPHSTASTSWRQDSPRAIWLLTSGPPALPGPCPCPGRRSWLRCGLPHTSTSSALVHS